MGGGGGTSTAYADKGQCNLGVSTLSLDLKREAKSL